MAAEKKGTKTIDPKQLQQSVIIPLPQLVPNKGQISGVPANPRTINVIKYKKLKESIEEDPEMLSLRELLVYFYEGKYVVIGGNMRYRAVKELGYKDVPCKIIPQDTPKDKLRREALKDNNNYGEWNYEELANLWDRDELERCAIDLPPMDGDVKEDEAEEDNFNVADALPSKAKAQEGDVYKLGVHRLVCGDSTDPVVLDVLMGNSEADLLLTDPPYNVDYSSKNEMLNAADKGNRVQKDIANDKMSGGAFQDFLTDAFTNANRYLKSGGAFYIWHADSEGYNFRTAIMRTGWQLRQTLIWNKNNMVLGRQDYQWKHEPCLYGWKEGAGHYFISRRDLLTVYEDKESLNVDAMSKAELKDLIKRMLQGDTPTTVIDEDKPLRSADHPTMKPLKLMGRLIRNSTRPLEVVLDLFGGSGSTMMAAEQLGRACYMVELDPCYIDVIIKRWEELTGSKAEYIGNFKNSEND